MPHLPQSVLGGAITYVAPGAMHAALLLSKRRAAAAGTAAAAGELVVTPWRRSESLALAADVALVVYGAIGQVVCGTAISWRHGMAQRRKQREARARGTEWGQ